MDFDVEDAAAARGSVTARAWVTRLPECGHDIANERPDELAALIRAQVAATEIVSPPSRGADVGYAFLL